MFQFTYKLKVAERVKAKCKRQPLYNPERDGRGGIKEGCSICFALYDLHQARLMLDSAHREFLRKAIPWTRCCKPRIKREGALKMLLRSSSPAAVAEVAADLLLSSAMVYRLLGDTRVEM
jgi:hypothetical protein